MNRVNTPVGVAGVLLVLLGGLPSTDALYTAAKGLLADWGVPITVALGIVAGLIVLSMLLGVYLVWPSRRRMI